MLCETEIQKVLTSDRRGWNAGLNEYSFFHWITFTSLNSGVMASGGGQQISLQVEFMYQIINNGQTIRFEYQDTEVPDWEIDFKPGTNHLVKEVDFDLYEGNFDIDEPHIGFNRYKYLLYFTKTPFPAGIRKYYLRNPFFYKMYDTNLGKVIMYNPNSDPRFQAFYAYKL